MSSHFHMWCSAVTRFFRSIIGNYCSLCGKVNNISTECGHEKVWSLQKLLSIKKLLENSTSRSLDFEFAFAYYQEMKNYGWKFNWDILQANANIFGIPEGKTCSTMRPIQINIMERNGSIVRSKSLANWVIQIIFSICSKCQFSLEIPENHCITLFSEVKNAVSYHLLSR